MPQSLSKVYVHLTFSTKYRHPFIDDGIKENLWNYIGGICKKLECNPIEVGGYYDHVHILCQLSRKISQMKLVEEVKSHSSKWIKNFSPIYGDFYWQDGYGIFSVNPSQIDVVIDYIKNQEAHHTNTSFKKELLTFLKKYNVVFDERFLWD